MSEYYEQYLLETYDIPEERLEMAEFDSIDEIDCAIRAAREARMERLKQQYIRIQVDRTMQKHGLKMAESAVLGRKEDDKRILYEMDDTTAVDVFISDKGTLATHVVGVNFGSEPTNADKEALENKEHKFCSKMAQIEQDLEDVGIVLRRTRTVPPDRNNGAWIQLDREKPARREREVRRRKRQDNRRVMYME